MNISELEMNYKYLQSLKEKGKKIDFDISGGKVTAYRQVVSSDSRIETLGYEKSIERGTINLGSEESLYQLVVSFPKLPFVPLNYARKHNMYPTDWTMLGALQMQYPLRYKKIKKGTKKNPIIHQETCEIYDCGDLYLLIGNINSKESNLMFVINK